MNNIKLSGILNADPQLMYDTRNINPNEEINITDLNNRCVVWFDIENNGKTYRVGAQGNFAAETGCFLKKGMNVEFEGVIDRYIDKEEKYPVDYIRITGFNVLEKEPIFINEVNISGYVNMLSNEGDYLSFYIKEDQYSESSYNVKLDMELNKNLKDGDYIELKGISSKSQYSDRYQIQALEYNELAKEKEISVLGYVRSSYFNEKGELEAWIDENSKTVYYCPAEGYTETYEGHCIHLTGDLAKKLNEKLEALKREENGKSRIERKPIRVKGVQEIVISRENGCLNDYYDIKTSHLTVKEFEVMPKLLDARNLQELGRASIYLYKDSRGYSGGKFTEWFTEKYTKDNHSEKTNAEKRLEKLLFEKCQSEIVCKEEQVIGVDVSKRDFKKTGLAGRIENISEKVVSLWQKKINKEKAQGFER